MLSRVLESDRWVRVQSWERPGVGLPEALGRQLGVEWPVRVGEVARGRVEVICVGLTEWLVLVAEGGPPEAGQGGGREAGQNGGRDVRVGPGRGAGISDVSGASGGVGFSGERRVARSGGVVEVLPGVGDSGGLVEARPGVGDAGGLVEALPGVGDAGGLVEARPRVGDSGGTVGVLPSVGVSGALVGVLPGVGDSRGLVETLRDSLRGSSFRATELSEGLARIRVEGAHAEQLMAKACAVTEWRAGSAARTLVAGVPVVVRCLEATVFECVVGLSFADYLMRWLGDAALEFVGVV